MKKIHLIFSAALLALSSGSVMAYSSHTGDYSVDEIRVDGTPWSSATTTLVTGQTYSVAVDLSYDQGPWLDPADFPYSDYQSAAIYIDGVTVWSASTTTPTYKNINPGGTYTGPSVKYAEWTLSSDLLFSGLIDPVGVYTATINHTGGPSSQQITMANPLAVPEPSTVLLMGLGLLGLGAVAKRRKA